mmetsp:Transcript_142816/g.397824  ORF Transcript_142816/g.397824 Transcript_142816/m.397824 type:complete len:272 (-) Transcript_142816:1020-1835(-)
MHDASVVHVNQCPCHVGRDLQDLLRPTTCRPQRPLLLDEWRERATVAPLLHYQHLVHDEALGKLATLANEALDDFLVASLDLLRGELVRLNEVWVREGGRERGLERGSGWGPSLCVRLLQLPAEDLDGHLGTDPRAEVHPAEGAAADELLQLQVPDQQPWRGRLPEGLQCPPRLRRRLRLHRVHYKEVKAVLCIDVEDLAPMARAELCSPCVDCCGVRVQGHVRRHTAAHRLHGAPLANSPEHHGEAKGRPCADELRVHIVWPGRRTSPCI